MSEYLHKHPKENDGRISDIDEAHSTAKIEYAGREASAKVKKGLFMSADKLAKLQDEAYRRAADNEEANQQWHDAMGPPEFEDDDWDNGPGWR